MDTVLRILKAAGGWKHNLYLRIENPPYMALVIEATDESGPCGLPALSVAHYGEQTGDAMRDPEMCFELGFAAGAHLTAFYYRNDYAEVEQWNASRGLPNDSETKSMRETWSAYKAATADVEQSESRLFEHMILRNNFRGWMWL